MLEDGAKKVSEVAKKIKKQITREQINKRFGICITSTKWVLICGLALIFLLGLVMFAIGVSAASSEKVTSKLKIPGIASLPVWMIVLGIFICIVAVVGALGAQLLNRVLLIIFVSILGVFLVAEIGVSIAAAVERNKLPELSSRAWQVSENSTKIYFQNTFNCCGYFNVTDRPFLPCPNNTDVGCVDMIFQRTSSIVVGIGSAAIVIAVLQAITIGITVALLVHITKVQHEYTQQLDDGGDEASGPITATEPAGTYRSPTEQQTTL